MHCAENPQETQNKQLMSLLSYAKLTSFGKRYGFGSISRYGEFKERVPLNDYESLKVYIDRMRLGEPDLLWPGLVRWFAKSSGTTSTKSKYIPVSSKAFQDCHFKGAKDVMAIYFSNSTTSKLFGGKALIMGGSSGVLGKKILFGDLSALLLLKSPAIGKHLTLLDTSISLIESWEEKLEVISEIAPKENITSLSGVPSWNLILLKKIIEKTRRENILEVWPNLELFIHGGVSFAPYREQFKKLIPSNQMNYLETFNASEGFFGIQDNPGSNDMLLMLDYGVFYEFVPVCQLNSENPEVVSLESVEVGKPYAMVITTNGGLWRYNIGDTIEFTSLNPYRFIIVGRTASFINTFGEELMVHNTDKAFEHACMLTNAVISEYTAGPVFLSGNTAAAHEFVVEFEKLPQSIHEFASIFDSTLKDLNSDYEAKRSNDILLRMPIIHIAPQRTFYNWMKKRGKVGGQNKVPRLSNDRLIIEDLFKFMNI